MFSLLLFNLSMILQIYFRETKIDFDINVTGT